MTPPNAMDLQTLDPEEFGNRVDELFSSITRRMFEQNDFEGGCASVELKAIVSRSTEQPTIDAIGLIIDPPIKDRDSYNKAFVLFYNILSELPVDTLKFHRPTLETFVENPEVPEGPAGESASARWKNLRREAKYLLRFMSDEGAVWVPEDKFDSIALRSLQERVTSAEEMSVHVPGLLDWLADGNWPPYQGCWKQLARFPEATIRPIGELLQRERGDGGWIGNILQFVDESVPMGRGWEELRPSIEALAEEPKGDENDWEIASTAREMLDKFDAWLQERSGRMGSGS
ncbi:hypothetical protein H072_8256 [Dactylellina haptotyla CBS 200.50]|uniref:DUF5071 domain-containing protein n=1 Tax=Dactylellina haptotyla (strain CBS 200.50) TaxID=1284197 RepID=S8A5F3_DACHA|nr:hypothetical protein H072_8256 [Dactylellina haptotyla CBS 200.50]